MNNLESLNEIKCLDIRNSFLKFENTVYSSLLGLNIQNDFILENLEKAELVFEITNSINRDFSVTVDFIDSNSQRQHAFTIFVAASSNNVKVVSNYTEVFEDVSLEALKSTSVLVFTLNMLPGAAINENTLGSISLKSKAVFYLNIDSSL